MQVVCQDGTIFQCAEFEAMDSGVLLFEEPSAEESEAETEEEEAAEAADEEQRAIGFVPIQQIRYVVSDALLEPGTGRQAAPARGSGGPSGAGAGQGGVGRGGAPQGSTPPAGGHQHGGAAPQSGGRSQPTGGYAPTDQQPQNR